MVQVDVLLPLSPPAFRRVLDWVVAIAAPGAARLSSSGGAGTMRMRGRVQSMAGLESISMFWALPGAAGRRAVLHGRASSATCSIPQARTNWNRRNEPPCRPCSPRWCCASRSASPSPSRSAWPPSSAFQVAQRQHADLRQGDVQRDQQVSAGRDSLLHPGRQPDGNRRHLAPAGGIRQEHRRRRAGRPAHDLRADLHDLRRGVGLVGGHHLRHRRHPDPGADQARLPDQLRGGAAGHQRGAGRDHPALDPDDPVRRERRGVDRRAVHRRLRPGPPDRRRADALRLGCMQVQGLGQERRRRPAGVRPAHLAGRAGRC